MRGKVLKEAIEIETKITEDLIQFEEDTGTRVDDIQINRTYAMGNALGTIIGLKINCSI